jgi:hypothetical protein
VTLTQQGGDVVATGSGEIDLTGLSFLESASAASIMEPSLGAIGTGASGGSDFYSGVTGPGSFGSGGRTVASRGSGNFVGINGSADAVLVPMGYVSDSPLSDTSTYGGQTFTSLGATPAKYEWTWGTGANQNFTLEIAAVPEPATWAPLLTGFAALGAMMRSRRRMATASI